MSIHLDKTIDDKLWQQSQKIAGNLNSIEEKRDPLGKSSDTNKTSQALNDIVVLSGNGGKTLPQIVIENSTPLNKDKTEINNADIFRNLNVALNLNENDNLNPIITSQPNLHE